MKAAVFFRIRFGRVRARIEARAVAKLRIIARGGEASLKAGPFAVRIIHFGAHDRSIAFDLCIVLGFLSPPLMLGNHPACHRAPLRLPADDLCAGLLHVGRRRGVRQATDQEIDGVAADGLGEVGEDASDSKSISANIVDFPSWVRSH